MICCASLARRVLEIPFERGCVGMKVSLGFETHTKRVEVVFSETLATPRQRMGGESSTSETRDIASGCG